MRPYIALLATVLPSLATAQAPLVLGHVPTRSGGKVVFTSAPFNCTNNMLMAYLVQETGQVNTRGCYTLIDEDLVVIWADNEVYSYQLKNLRPSEELKEYANRTPE